MTQDDLYIHKLETDVARGAEAEAELNHVAAAFETLRADLIAAWQASDAGDEKGRQNLWVATKMLTQVEATLRAVVRSGTTATKMLDKIRTHGETPRKSLFRRRI